MDIKTLFARVDALEKQVKDLTERLGNGVNTPPEVVVTRYEHIPLKGSDDIDIRVWYSDGTTDQYPWKKVNKKGAVITDGDGSNEKLIESVTYNGPGDDTLIGRAK